MGDFEKAGLEPIERSSVRNRVYEQLRAAVLGGRFLPGQKMMIRALAAELGTSPTPIREALTRLHAERVLDLQANGTAIIPIMTEQRFEQITVLRIGLEGCAAKEAARYIKDEEIDALDETLQRMLRLIEIKSLDQYLVLHRDFHFGIYRCARNQLLSSMVEDLWAQCGPTLTCVVPDYVLRRSGSREHWNAIEALRHRDGEAARAAIARDIQKDAEYIKALLNSPQGMIGSAKSVREAG